MSQNTVLLQNRYRIRQVLGTGGFSTIYLAQDEVTGQDVAIKEFTADHMDGLSTILRVNAYDIANRSEPQPVENPAELSSEEKLARGLMQIRREAYILELLSGTGGVPYPIGTFEENDTIYLVREYLEGMTCQDYMYRFRGRMPFSFALYIMRGTLEILKTRWDISTVMSARSTASFEATAASALSTGEMPLTSTAAWRTTWSARQSMSAMLPPNSTSAATD